MKASRCAFIVRRFPQLNVTFTTPYFTFSPDVQAVQMRHSLLLDTHTLSLIISEYLSKNAASIISHQLKSVSAARRQIDMVVLAKKSEINTFYWHSYLKQHAVIVFLFHPPIFFLDTFTKCTLFHRAPQQ